MTEDLARYREWIGRKRVDEDVVTPFPPRALAATFDTPDDAPGAGDPLPPAWHWLFFLDTTRASKLSTDGLPGRGDFLPPVPLPRRMWAGNRLTFHEAPLRIGDPMRRETEIAAVEPKSGSSGTMVFITTRARIHGPAGLAIEEEYDMVLREAARPGETQRVPDRAPAKADISRTVDPDPVLLFRFSALTFNPH
ncbi:MAG: MaoC family dehydratase N-terminal domain-containing protein, partial [Rhodospirillales bacterium]|nr:MaoC family dehydratase N-terminal domain-containing protein [Rhodospirillales bacterium]